MESIDSSEDARAWSHLQRPLQVLIVGGGSRAAQPFRKRLAASADMTLHTLMRRPTPALARETVIPVTDYFDPPASDLEWADVVVNFAGVPASNDEALLAEINARGPARLAAKAKARGVAQLVHVSSMHVYGYTEDIGRTTPENPSTPYAKSKLAADVALNALADASFRVTLLRPPMHYGGGSGVNLIRLANMMKRLRWFPVPARPNPRSTVHVENLAVGLRHIVQNRLDGVRFVTDAEPFTINILAEVLGAATGRRIHLLTLPDVAFYAMKAASKNLYTRIYGKNLVRPADRLEGPVYPVSLRDGLFDMLRRDPS